MVTRADRGKRKKADGVQRAAELLGGSRWEVGGAEGQQRDDINM